MVIGVLTTSYPRWPGDFAGAFVADRVAALVAGGHAVEVVAGGGSAETSERAPGPVPVTRLPARLGDGPDLFGGAGAPEALEAGGAATIWAAARFSVGLVAAVAARASRWQRLESHWLAPCGLAGLAGAPRLPHRAYAHAGDVALLERVPLGRTLARQLVAGGVEIVFVSQALRARFARLAGRPSGTVEQLPIPAALFSAAAPPQPGPRRAHGLGGATVASVGRLVPIKGFDLLVRACAPRGAGDAPIALIVVGEGPERPRLQCLAARLGVPLRLPGLVGRDRVAGWLRGADLYVQPSRVLANGRTEGLPVAAREALAVGLAVVASDAGGLAELAGREKGVTLFPAGDAAALGRVIRDQLAANVSPL